MEYNYKALGLKAGLEVHQQLNTGKLFCRCKSAIREDKPDYYFSRKIRPVPSELGEYDQAALDAFKKNLTYEYELFDENNCMIEMDEEPPKYPNKAALKTVFESALILNANILDEMHVMRKTIIDGSNVSGFQRTMLVALGGKIPLKNKEVEIETIILEEDSARPTLKSGQKINYRIDRLGIPLIEMTTKPELFSPEEVKECALKMGEVFRLTGNARRGLGTIRQDVNISIAEGERVEIKGIQDIEITNEYIKREVQRQIALVGIRNELKKRKAEKNEIQAEPKDVTVIFTTTDSKLVKGVLQKGNNAVAVKLKGFAKLLGWEVQPKRRFGTELATYVKVRTGLRGLLHSDELPNYGITQEEIDLVKKDVNAKKDDAFVIVLGPKEKCLRAIETVAERCRMAFDGVPKETRGAIGEGNTEYQRPLAGSARMYPETDLKPMRSDEKELNKLKGNLPMWAEERKEWYKIIGLSETLADAMKLNNNARFFRKMVEKKFNPKTVAVLLIETMKKLQRENHKTENVTFSHIEEILELEKKGKLDKDNFETVLKKVAENPFDEIEKIAKDLKSNAASSTEIEAIVAKIVRKNSAIVKNQGMRAVGPLMGDVMRELKGKASGKQISELLKKEISKYN